MSAGCKITPATQVWLFSHTIPRFRLCKNKQIPPSDICKYKTILNLFDLRVNDCQSFLGFQPLFPSPLMSIKNNYFSIQSSQSGLMSVPALYNSWLAMSNICGSPQSGWMPGWIMHRGGTAGGGHMLLCSASSGFWTCDTQQNNSWKGLDMW